MGRALAHGLGDHGRWRFVGLLPEVASSVAGLLGGEVHSGADVGWDVVSAASVLRVNVTAGYEAALWFRLAEVPELGVFELRFTPWTLVEVLGPEAGALADQLPGPVMCELAAQVVDFTTLTGGLERLTVPSLARCA